MALGVAVVAQRFENPRELLGERLRGVHRLLADHGDRLFPDDYFADLYTRSRLGRPTVPARVLATVMVLQSLEGLSDQEAVDHLECDLRWQSAAGVDAGYVAFHSTVLVGQRNRLRASDRPKRFLEDTKVVAREAGVMRDRVRVLDSTPIYDAVSTQDTVTQLRSAIRKLLRALEESALAGRVRRHCRVTTTMSGRASRRVIGTTPKLARCSSTRWSATRSPRWPSSMVKSWSVRSGRQPSCWRSSPAKTLSRVMMVGSGSPARWPVTG